MTDDFTTEDLLNELQQYHQPVPDRREGGVTQQEYAKVQGINVRTAGNRLNDLVEQGVLTKEKQRCEDGQPRLVYYKA